MCVTVFVLPALPEPDPAWPAPTDDALEDNPNLRYSLARYHAHLLGGGTDAAWHEQVRNDAHFEKPPLAALPQVQRAMRASTGNHPMHIDMCPNGCISFGKLDYRDLDACNRCNAPRYLPPLAIDPDTGAPPPPGAKPRPAKQWIYTSFIASLQAAFANPDSALAMRDRSRRQAQRAADREAVEAAGGVYEVKYDDIEVGYNMEEIIEMGLLQDERTAVLAFGWDGALIVERSDQSAWFIFIINHNLPKSLRFKSGMWGRISALSLNSDLAENSS